MHTLSKLIALNQAILKIDVELFDDIFPNTSKILELQKNILTQSNSINTHNNTIQQISEKIFSNTIEKSVSSFGEKNTNAQHLMQRFSAISDTHKVSDTLVSPLSNLEFPHSLTNVNSSGIKNLEENSIKNSKTIHSSNHSTNIHIDKVEINDVSNINDLALQLQQKVSTL